MLIVFISITGKISSFLQKTGYEHCFQIFTGKEIVDEPFVLMCGSVGFGESPVQLVKFLENNHNYMKAVIGSGNKNWGNMYGKAPRDISKKYGVPLLFMFESSGNSYDIEQFHQIMKSK